MRKLSIAFAVAVVASVLLLTPGIALANFGVHGGYSMDTDACAGCHRAHTASSSIRWYDGANSGSALLITDADETFEFCLTCHGSGALGAATNVVDGVYENGLYAPDAYGDGGQRLNSGLFDLNNVHGVGDSKHSVTGSWGAWGGGETGRDGIISTGYGEQIPMSCTSCHDVHGSSNYRILKDYVNGVRVGGYDGDTPTPYVISHETGYPTAGWELHEAGALAMGTYQPNYTTPAYARAPGDDPNKGISNWCAACHTQYTVAEGTTSIDHGFNEYFAGTADLDGAYDANDGFGFVKRYRHPVNVPMSNYAGPRELKVDPNLPLAGTGAFATQWVDCLTCHVAHGSDAQMSGYARVDDSTNPEPDTGPGGPGDPDRIGGVAPTWSNALLRLDDRGVCQECHNK